MANSILPSGEEMHVTPAELLRYLNPDGLRQLMQQERIHWNLKPNRDVDYIDPKRKFKYAGMLQNDAKFQRMEIRTFPDNGAFAGYAGMYVDSGLCGILHNLEKWDHGISGDSVKRIVNRVQIGAMASITDKLGYGLEEDGTITTKTGERIAMMEFDPWDGRVYLYSNDDPQYVNNETRAEDEKLPKRTVARIGDIPTHVTDLINDLDFVADPDYRHTENDFTHSNRFVIDNLDDRTFVYPEIAKDASGDYIENKRVGLSGEFVYSESDAGENVYNSQPDLGEAPDLGEFGDRLGEGIHSHGANKTFSGVSHPSGYFPGIFRSLEELERVDLVGQLRVPMTHQAAPGAKRPHSYYLMDGKWGSTWFDRDGLEESYRKQGLNPRNMELDLEGTEPTPFDQLPQSGASMSTSGKLYQWRYNRVTVTYHSRDIEIRIVQSGQQYRVGDVLRWTFGDDVFLYVVSKVGSNGQIQEGSYRARRARIFEQDPSTHGVGVTFSNMSGVGHGALLSVHCKATIETIASQLKNNLYAYVDVTPTVRSNNSSEWSDISVPDSQGGRINVRSTAPGPAYSGVNAGRGGPTSKDPNGYGVFYEHGGNATAGAHVHLFRYVIDTLNPKWVEKDGIKVYTGRWVDQGPMGVERPCDIKALYLSNPDTNNFNNYYKFMLDSLLDSIHGSPDEIETNDVNALSLIYMHVAQRDPSPNQRFYVDQFDPITSNYERRDVTKQVLYINGASGVAFFFNSTYKNDSTYGYGMRAPGWIALAGGTAK